MNFRRKPGEPIYLRGHMVALLLAVLAPVLLPMLYEKFMGPLGFGLRLVAGMVIAIAAGGIVYLLYRASARNEP